ncbi:MAG TPA: class I SAM-dependent methyltransferase [bacterium]|nr:class I SAM-dependent methyltransferase [bacterium]
MDEPKQTIRRGYDLVSTTYRSEDFDFQSSGYRKYLDWVRDHTGPGTSVLDLGCGCGIPVASQLGSRGCEVLGIDISPVQIERARRLVPQARFLCGDAMEADLGSDTFDLVVAFYSIIHFPLSEQPSLLKRIGGWVKPGGLFLGTIGPDRDPGHVEEDWLGVPGATMFWSHEDPEFYRETLMSSGFRIDREDVLVDSGGHRHPVLLAERVDS